MNPKKLVIGRHYIDKDESDNLLVYVGTRVGKFHGCHDFDAVNSDDGELGYICDDAQVECDIREVKENNSD